LAFGWTPGISGNLWNYCFFKYLSPIMTLSVFNLNTVRTLLYARHRPTAYVKQKQEALPPRRAQRARRA